MFSEFFVARPIFTWVIAIFIMAFGVYSLLELPVEQYPEIAPPQISITATYPGASAETLENTVTQIIEQNLTGIDDLRYIKSESSSSGRATITLTFEPEADPDIAQVQTQNKVAQSLSSLPAVVRDLGVPIEKASSSFTLIAGFYSRDESMNRNDISDFLASTLQEPLSRVDGVGRIQTFGTEHAMRVWLNPTRMNSFGITASDVIAALKEQNVQLATGAIGGAPIASGQTINASIMAKSLLSTPEEFGAILLRVLEDGSDVRLDDIARIEIGAENYNIIGRWNRKPASGIAIELAAGANALTTIEAVKDRIGDFEDVIPKNLDVVYPIDNAPYIRDSIANVVVTLGIAIVLVVLVIYLFLQTFRATFIPAIAIPIVLLGTLGFLLLMDFSINVLTLFALVLAIGMLVDDAIVVTENVERKLEEDSSVGPKEAASEAMQEISGALVGTTLVIWAVFLPMSFFEGSIGIIYRQFAITISIAMAISLFIALTLSPSLCGSILKPAKATGYRGFFGVFNRGFARVREGHQRLMDALLDNRVVLPLLFVALITASILLFMRLPTSFLPDEDQGFMFTLLTGPPGSTLEQTLEKVEKTEDFYLDRSDDAVAGMFAAAGFSFAGRAQNVGLAFIKMKRWDERGESNSVFRLKGEAMQALSGVRDARIFPVIPPPVSALGNASGFEFQLIDRTGLGQRVLSDATDRLLKLAGQSELLTQVRFNGLADSPQYDLQVDDLEAQALGIPFATVNETLGVALAGTYVNDFLEKGRVKRVYVQADAPYRMMPDDVGDWYVRNDSEGMVSLAQITSGEWAYGSPKLTRFNGSSSREIQGSPAQGVSSGEAMQEVLRLAEDLEEGLEVAWTGVSYEERQASTNIGLLYALATLAVFFILAALYESWAIPLSIILVVPLGIFGAALATWLAGQANDVYFQVGLLITIGLAAKNAILVVEFAQINFENGMSAYDAAYKAAERRFRPIVMTSLTFILGVLPLAFASGPGSAAQKAISIGVLGGITSITLLVVVFAPYFFIWIFRSLGKDSQRTH